MISSRDANIIKRDESHVFHIDPIDTRIDTQNKTWYR